MININLPFWLDGPELEKLRTAAVSWWAMVETWVKFPVTQTDPLTAVLPLVNLLAFQRNVTRFKDEPEDLFRKRVKFALINNQDAGSKAGFIAIFERLGIGYVEIEERFDAVDWDVIRLNLSDSQLGQNLTLINQIIISYGRTCRRYQLVIITPITAFTPVFSHQHDYSYHTASL